MATSHSNSSNNVYSFAYENPTEMVRMTEQIWLLTKAMGSSLGAIPEPTEMQSVLDISCGPGDWVLDVAFSYPHLDVAGIDTSRVVIDYANAKAHSQKLDNASFGVMDFLQPLDFSDNSFDIIHGSYWSLRVPRDKWPVLLRECMRVLRPGGILTLLDSDSLQTNNALSNQFSLMFSQAMREAGLGFSPDGQSIGITPVLASLLRNAGFQHVKLDAYAIDFSVGSENWLTVTRGLEVTAHLLTQMLIQLGVQLPPMLNDDYQAGRLALMADDFCGIWPLLNVWGRKPV